MRVLFLTHRLPYAPNRGDRIRAYHELRVLGQHAEVDLVSLTHDADETSHAGEIRDMVTSISLARVSRLANLPRAAIDLATSRPLTHSLLSSPDVPRILHEIVATRPPDVVLAFCSGMARYVMEPPLAGLPFVLDMVDVDSRKWAALGQTTRSPLKYVYRREANTLAAFEAIVTDRAHATTVVNERERDEMLRVNPRAGVHVVPNGIDIATFRRRTPPAPSSRVVFCGVFDYPPNEDGAIWLAREVWPLVRHARPDAVLTLVGMRPTTRVQRLALEGSIEVTGAVPDVREYLWSSAVSVAPLQVARGIQNKVLEAIAAGLSCVVTSAVHEGLPPQVRRACAVADDPASFAQAIVGVLARDPAARTQESTAVLEGLSWEQQLVPLVALLKDASGRA